MPYTKKQAELKAFSGRPLILINTTFDEETGAPYYHTTHGLFTEDDGKFHEIIREVDEYEDCIFEAIFEAVRKDNE